MRNQLRLRMEVAAIALFLVAGVGHSALGASVDFETAEGYSVGDLHGQPSSGNQWSGDVTSKIAVTAAQSQSGAQSVLIDPGLTTGKVSDDLAVGSVPTQFSLKFYWRPSGTSSGDAVVYLSEFGGATTTFIGPWVQFVGSGTVYQIKYVENGAVTNIKSGMLPAKYEDNWWEVAMAA